MTSTDRVSDNLRTIGDAVECHENEALFLPENSLFQKVGRGVLGADTAFSIDSPAIKTLQELCCRRKVTLHLGAIPWREDNKIVSKSVIIGADGHINSQYSKVHLFDLDLGSLRIRESDSFSPGRKLSTFQLAGWKCATTICYDLRFPELFVHYVENEGVEVFIVPAAFTVPTGEAHWQTLVRARAIETQCYIIAPAQVGVHRSQQDPTLRKTWGESLVVDPWGKILVQKPNHWEYLDLGEPAHSPKRVMLTRKTMEEARLSMPLSRHRAFRMSLEPV